MTWKLFLDDERFPPDDGGNWVICRNVTEAIEYCSILGLPNFISFDHDLGKREFNGLQFAKWLVEHCLNNDINLPECYVHSQNPVGKKNIEEHLNCFLRCYPRKTA